MEMYVGLGYIENAILLAEEAETDRALLTEQSVDLAEGAEIHIISHNAEFDALEEEWNELAADSDIHIFQTFEWNRTWWKHFGKERHLHIFTFYSEGRIAGIAPFFRDKVTLLGQNIFTFLRFLGSNVSSPEGEPLLGLSPYSDYLDFIIRPGHEQEFYRSLIQHLAVNRDSYDEIILDEVPETSSVWQHLIPEIKKQGLSCRIENASSSPVITLEDSWKSYLDSMNSKERYNVRRYYDRSQNGKHKEFNIREAESADEMHWALKELIRMHQRQWNDRGFAGTFAEKRMKDFFTEISELFFNKGWMKLKMAFPADNDDGCVAIDALSRYKNKVYLMHRGLEMDSRYRKLGPGNVLLYTTMKEAIQNDVNTFEFLRGLEEFKLREATKVNQNKRVTVFDNPDTGRQLTALIHKYINLRTRLRLEILHYKIIAVGKPFTAGLKDYASFLNERIRMKLNKVS